MTIHEKETDLFRRWQEYYYNLFCWDGLHRTGSVSKKSGSWVMVPDGKEEERWQKSPLRCMFLTKDYNHNGDYEGIDIRYETGLNGATDDLYHPFHTMYQMLLYGIMHIDLQDFSFPDISKATDHETCLDYFCKAPVVRINTKKLSGVGSCNLKLLQKFVSQDSEFITEQINIYDANIIVCCDGSAWDIHVKKDIYDSSNPIMELLHERFSDLKYYNDWIYYSEKDKVIVLHEYHMSTPGMSYEKFYGGVAPVAEFLSKHKDYLR